MTDIKTYPSMNKEIKYILGQSESHTDQYAVARIVELEKALEFYADEDNYTVLDGERIKGIFTDQGEKAREAIKEDEAND